MEWQTFPVVDVFAGPGGLGEGFSAFSTPEGIHPFKIALSVEKDPTAHETLRLRSFFRQFPRGEAPEIYYDVLRRNVPLRELPNRLKDAGGDLYGKWKAADAEAMQAELGSSEESHAAISRRIERAIGGKRKPWVLIGGPPCQAYSIVGRVRNLGNSKYRIEEDHRSSLYCEYLRIISEHRPAIFVMENVKGMLSATVAKQGVFDTILSDLKSPPTALNGGGPPLRYRLLPVVQPARRRRDSVLRPTDFVVACEKYGVPQQRHRVILVGIREDLGDVDLPRLTPSPAPPVSEIIGSLPPLRSGLSRTRQGDRYLALKDDPQLWIDTIRDLTIREGDERRWLRKLGRDRDRRVHDLIVATARKLNSPQTGRGGEFIPLSDPPTAAQSLHEWYVDDRLGGICNHESRVHLDTDLARYLFAACHAQVFGESPKLDRFPADLQPNHANAASLIFDDRFRVQVAGSAGTTVTSHLSKDGHYFIHYDPAQCRSMTVREVARLQTFPDNYLFCGPRTAQYVQVGNAVPPWVARQIAECIWQALVNSGKVG